MKFRLLVLVLTLVIGAASAGAQTTATLDASSITLTPVASGFVRPLYVTHAPDGSGRLFVVEQGGRIWVIDADGQRLPEPFLDLSSRVSPEALNLSMYTERGLLGLAFHPDYAENGLFYVNYTDIGGTTVVARYSVSENNPNAADPDSVHVILTQEQPFANHNGGHMAFGPDGYLYIGLGDGGSRGDPLGAGQDLSMLLGKILRIDVNVPPGSNEPYAIPPDNPFVGRVDARPEIWAYGLRNPWRFSFDRETGDLYIADVGQNQYEEVNFQPAESDGGENYGWNIYEATHPYSGASAPADMVLPFFEYSHREGNSVTGGYVYRGEAIPALYGYYLFGDFGSGRMWASLRAEDGTWTTMPLNVSSGAGRLISSFGEDQAGELYLVDYNGVVYRFAPVG